MVNLICGRVGSGKTKRLIKLANEAVKKTKGDIVYIQENNKHITDLRHEIRLINAMEYDINNIDTFHGFLCGIISEDYDIEKVYIDGIYKMIDIKENYEKLQELINKIEKLGNKHDIQFTLTLSRSPEEVPDEFGKYIMTM